MFLIRLLLFRRLTRDEKKMQKTIDSYHEIAKRIAELKPDTIIITTPHSILYSDYFHISPGSVQKETLNGLEQKMYPFGRV